MTKQCQALHRILWAVVHCANDRADGALERPLVIWPIFAGYGKMNNVCVGFQLRKTVALLACTFVTACPRELTWLSSKTMMIRLVADVHFDEEILVDYGTGFFASEACACCSCAGRYPPPQPGEYARGGGNPSRSNHSCKFTIKQSIR